MIKLVLFRVPAGAQSNCEHLVNNEYYRNFGAGGNDIFGIYLSDTINKLKITFPPTGNPLANLDKFCSVSRTCEEVTKFTENAIRLLENETSKEFETITLLVAFDNVACPMFGCFRAKIVQAT